MLYPHHWFSQWNILGFRGLLVACRWLSSSLQHPSCWSSFVVAGYDPPWSPNINSVGHISVVSLVGVACCWLLVIGWLLMGIVGYYPTIWYAELMPIVGYLPLSLLLIVSVFAILDGCWCLLVGWSWRPEHRRFWWTPCWVRFHGSVREPNLWSTVMRWGCQGPGTVAIWHHVASTHQRKITVNWWIPSGRIGEVTCP